MKQLLISLSFCFAISFYGYAQQVTLNPSCGTPSQEVTITFNAADTPLQNAGKVYAHAGVVTNNTNNPTGADWRFVKGNWGQDNGVGEMTKVAGTDTEWELKLSPTLREYFGVPAADDIFWLALVFRNATGSQQTSPDIYIRVGSFIDITAPEQQEIFIDQGDLITFTAKACPNVDELRIEIDEGNGFEIIESISGSVNELSAAFEPTTTGTLKARVVAIIGTEESINEREFSIFLKAENIVAEIPAGNRPGINYYADDDTKVTLVLETPVPKDFVFVAGDFNNWTADPAYFMKQTPEGKHFWLTIEDLVPGKEYVFQYWVDGEIKIGDPYAEKVADPWNDEFIPAATYPNLPVYTRREFGVASVLQTAQTPYEWSAQEANWVRPHPEHLNIYECLIRDFVGGRNYKEMADTLSYFKRLGINAIKLMPIMEFEGNLSWGYNPSYFFAPDKFYGSKDDLKRFIDLAHQNGIAVILDIALNHAFGQNPMVRMYWDNQNNRPAENNPWFNPIEKHPFNVGYDFNHESPYTKAFVDSVTRYWIREYHIDGYRFDLSKGFSQRETFGNVSFWSTYDQSRINIWDTISKRIWDLDPTSIVILEHFADLNEELTLGNMGMYLWKNLNHDYRELLKGNTNQSISNDALGKIYVSYSESHDEERTAFDMINFGSSASGYNIRSEKVMLDRAKMGAAFLFTLPGAKMLWQFQEFGYDKSINYCPNGTISANCRLDNKPLIWGAGGLGYYENPDRRRLFESYAAIFKLVNNNMEVFKNGNTTWTNTGAARRINIRHTNMDVTIIGNFSTASQTINPNFSKTGTWYDYFSGAAVQISNATANIPLAPGQFHIFTTVPQEVPGADLITSVEEEFADAAIALYPNPVQDKIYLEWPSAANQLYIEVFDLMGRRLHLPVQQIDSRLYEINAQGTQPGIYLIKASDGNNKVTRRIHKTQ
ncbi:MAG TPA: alpha-amylase family glycosyl hydrolase [Cyclobacteriaceae bacterium]|nr:alpha-amylase family glycosyl hydrolase [Cyclobacteriaceae bacterium]